MVTNRPAESYRQAEAGRAKAALKDSCSIIERELLAYYSDALKGSTFDSAVADNWPKVREAIDKVHEDMDEMLLRLTGIITYLDQYYDKAWKESASGIDPDALARDTLAKMNEEFVLGAKAACRIDHNMSIAMNNYERSILFDWANIVIRTQYPFWKDIV